jgi:CBS domain-containing protein
MLTVSNVMKKNVVILQLGKTVSEAVEKMWANRVGSVVVCDNNKVVGILTDGDVNLRVTSKGKDRHLTLVDDVMTTDVHFCRPTDNISDVVATMSQRKIEHLVVFSQRGDLVGLLALRDIEREFWTKEAFEVKNNLYLATICS